MSRFPSPILLVEDDKVMRTALSRVWGQEGVVVFEADSVQEATEILKSQGQKIKGVVIDWVLPDGLGGDILNKMDQLGLNRLPCVLITALSELDLSNYQREKICLLQKPFQDPLEPVKQLLA